jgi:hypothetical protein
MRVRYGLSAPDYAALGLVRLAKGMRLGRLADGLPWRPNAPRQPRRWQRCEASRRRSGEECQSHAQVRGRASGVVLHAVVRRKLAFTRALYVFMYEQETLVLNFFEESIDMATLFQEKFR